MKLRHTPLNREPGIFLRAYTIEPAHFHRELYQKYLNADGIEHISIVRNPVDRFISTFEKDSIFYGLTVPQDITITKQLIFDDHSEKASVLAKLNDNTPLVSMRKFGKGEIILFHIGAEPE